MILNSLADRLYLFLMCFLRPLKVKKIEGRKVILENGIKAYYDKKVGTIKKDDLVMVYGNLVLHRVKLDSKIDAKNIQY